ncbi:ATP-binding protein [Streptomyces tateyamensis]|uniref:ATP-binding protein n=1 Tax=Streptomyces tateyamensis TaxID=565073 RepID=A0A2V4N9U4_9ACTN|nr:ATP-binding protein [Streptomyces tateyamensis]PYC71651.1 ATP-binding protein [Streptomyces tateyamensis]
MPGIEIPAIPRSWRFPAQLASVPRVRRAIFDALPKPCPPQLSYELRLLASELATNAIKYGASAGEDETIELVFWTADGYYWLAVSDPGEGWPRLRTSDGEASGGRGLVLVEALSEVWGVAPRAVRGKAVVAGVRRTGW